MSLTNITTLTDQFSEKILYPGLNQNEQRRRIFYALVSILCLILSFISAGRGSVMDGLYSPNTVIPLISAFVALGCLLAVRLLRYMDLIYLLSVGYYAVAILYSMIIGADHGTAYLWLYAYPMMVYALLGTKRGNIFVLFVWSASLLVITLQISEFSYPPAIGISFLLSFTLTCILAYGIELSRMRYYNQLQDEKAALENALYQLETLQKLLPICASCKKIRDDSGYWHQVENYMHEHRGIEFSHGICPDCHADLLARRPHSQKIPAL